MTAISEPPVRFARVNGRRWRIELVETLVDSEGAPNLGQCDADDRRIALRIGPRHQLQDTLFHELVHAACPSLDEDTVHSHLKPESLTAGTRQGTRQRPDSRRTESRRQRKSAP